MKLPGQHALDDQILQERNGEWFLVGSRCPACSTVYYPPRRLCADDLDTCETVDLSRYGTLYEAVQVLVAPQGFDAPYWIAYVDLPEGPRVFAPLKWTEPGEPRHGAKVVWNVEVVKDGPHETLGPVFIGPIPDDSKNEPSERANDAEKHD
jgi:uncharacterized OB-fold protein